MGGSSSTPKEQELADHPDDGAQHIPNADMPMPPVSPQLPQSAIMRSGVDNRGRIAARGSEADVQQDRLREEFAALWSQNTPYGLTVRTVSRADLQKVLRRAIAQKPMSPRARPRAEEAMAKMVGNSTRPASYEEGFAYYCAVLSSVEAASDDLDGSTVTDPGAAVLPPGAPWEVPTATFVNASSSPWPTSSSAAMGKSRSGTQPRGARMVDKGHSMKGDGVTTHVPDGHLQVAGKSGPKHRQLPQRADVAMPMRPTRAGLESAYTDGRASLNAAQAAYERLVLKAEEMRAVLAQARHPVPMPQVQEATKDGRVTNKLAELQRLQNVHRVKVMSLEVELDRYMERIRFSASIHEKQKKEIVSLKEECAVRAQKHKQAENYTETLNEEMRSCTQDRSDLLRTLRTEQLRVTMLRRAFEEEQTRVGLALAKAESHVCDLVAANESTRGIEVQENSIARECATAYREIRAGHANDEYQAEARETQLKMELQSARQDAVQVKAMANYAKVEAERHSASMELGEVQRKNQGIVAISKQRVVEVQAFRSEIDELKARADDISREIQSTTSREEASERTRMLSERVALLRPRISAEQTVKDALQRVEAHLSDELREAEEVLAASEEESMAAAKAEARRHGAMSTEFAQECAQQLEADLEGVRGELSAPDIPKDCIPYDATLDLQAAGLQRRLGNALAKEKEYFCRTWEISLTGKQLGEEPPDNHLDICYSSVQGEIEDLLEAEVDRRVRELQVREESIKSVQARVHELEHMLGIDGDPVEEDYEGWDGIDVEGDEGEVRRLQNQLRVLCDELRFKDAEIARLDRLASGPANGR